MFSDAALAVDRMNDRVIESEDSQVLRDSPWAKPQNIAAPSQPRFNADEMDIEMPFHRRPVSLAGIAVDIECWREYAQRDGHFDNEADAITGDAFEAALMRPLRTLPSPGLGDNVSAGCHFFKSLI